MATCSKRLRWGWAGVLIIALLGCDDPASQNGDGLVPDNPPAVASGVITFSINHPIPVGAKTVRIWLPYLTSNDYQSAYTVSLTGNFDESQLYYEPENGNVILFAQWLESAEIVARLSYSVAVKRAEMLKNQFPPVEGPVPVFAEHYLGATSLGPVDGVVADLAAEIVQGATTTVDKARAIYDYIVVNSVRDPEVAGCGKGDVLSLLQNLSGKCVDLSAVFVALARAAGVPAREIFGTRISKTGDITGNYHCRAEFYVPYYGWVPVDPSDVRKLMLNEGLTLDDPAVQSGLEYYFGSQTETYLDFYTGRDIVLSPPQNAPPLNYFMYPQAEIDGSPLELLEIYENSLSVTFEPG